MIPVMGQGGPSPFPPFPSFVSVSVIAFCGAIQVGVVVSIIDLKERTPDTLVSTKTYDNYKIWIVYQFVSLTVCVSTIRFFNKAALLNN